jgi:flagellar biosynthesis/type III secretory pathway protein FliH
LFRIPRESVRIIDTTPTAEEETTELELPEESVAAEPAEEESRPDYDAVAEAMELKLESLNTQIKVRQEELGIIVTSVQTEADNIKADAEAEAERIKADAHELGYSEGKASADLALIELRNSDKDLVNKALQEIGEAKAQALARQEDEIVSFCFDIVKKIFGTDFERGQEALIKQALKELGASESNFTPVDTIFDYEGQTIDASFETQLRKIRDEFTKIPRGG